MRKFFSGFLTVWLVLLIVFGLPLTAAVRTFTDKENLTKALTSQAVYDSLKVSANDAVNKKAANSAGGDTDVLDSQALSKIVNHYFSYDFYKQSVATAAGGVFDWLDGKTTKPEFNIVITQDKAEFKSFITSTLAERYQALPACTKAPGPDYDALSADCRLPGLSPAQVKAGVAQEIGKHSAKLLNQATLSSNDIFKNLKPQDTTNAQGAFHAARNLAWVVFVFIVLLGIGIWALAPVERRWRTAGTHLLVPSIIAALLAISLLASAEPAVGSRIKLGNQPTEVSLDPTLQQAVTQAVRAVGATWLIYALVLIAIAVGCLLLHKKLEAAPKPAKRA